MKRKIIFFILVLLWGAAECIAYPDLDNFTDIEGVRVYGDNESSQTYYLSPAAPLLESRPDGSPDYGLSLYRYLGTKGTGDAGSFWVRGVLTFGIDRERESGITAEIRKKLKNRGVKSPRVKSMPVTGSRMTLLFADRNDSSEYAMRWKTGITVVPLAAHQAEILWDAVAAGQTLVSVSIEETFSGVRKTDEEWTPSDTAMNWTVPVEMDMAAHPDHFQKMDLGGRMQMGYTGLDIFCFDFIENLEENLYAKTVEVAIPAPGRNLIETVTFKDDGEYRSRIEFKLAKDLDQPYRYRISRVWQDGSRDVGAWQEKEGETLLDITAYRNTDDMTDDTTDDTNDETGESWMVP